MSKFIIYIAPILMMVSCSKPMANFMVDQEKAEAPTKVKFVNKSENAEEYFWDMGDGTTLEGQDVEHRYILSGKYDVKLTAKKGGKSNTETKKVVINPPKDCLVEIETSMGTMIVKLYDETPLHRENFIKLADQEYYDGLLFHRVIEGFMIQGGDPNSKGAGARANLGSGGPGYKIAAEFDPKLIHKKGALAAARQGDQVNPQKKSSGSQFYIVQGKPLSDSELERIERRKGVEYTKEIKEIYTTDGGTPFLDYDYTVFGEVIEGLEVIDKIAKTNTAAGDRPKEDVAMKIRVIK